MIFRLNSSFHVSNWSTCSQPVGSSWIDWSDVDYKHNVVYSLMMHLTVLSVARVIRHSTLWQLMMMMIWKVCDWKWSWLQ